MVSKSSKLYRPDSVSFSSSGKEKDAETGLSYFGARYYEPGMLNIWLSVDPMADKYLNLSPYNYCAWNPIKLVDPNGEESIENYDGWKVDRQNKTIMRINLNGGDFIQYVEGDGDPIRYNTSRSGLLNDYKGYKVVDIFHDFPQLNPTEDGINDDGVSVNAIVGTFAAGTGFGCNRMSKAIFDYQKGTYMGKDGCSQILKKGKNGGLNGRYKSQIKTSINYTKAGRICTAVGFVSALVSIGNTEIQFNNGNISQGERWTNHAIDVIGLTPIGCFVPLSYELGKNHGPSTWF